MRGSLRFARLFGIDIFVHPTFALLLVLIAIESAASHGARGAFYGLLNVFGLFACVTFHELGHSLVARRFGGQVRQIVLLPIGGVARMSREPTRPLHELLIAIAGPLVNVVIAAGLFAAFVAQLGKVPDEATWMAAVSQPGPKALWLTLIAGNVTLAVFNLIPAFPMDGGRVLRALLSFWIGRVRATTIAVTIGQLLAFALLGYAILNANPWLALLAAFVFFSAGQEKQSARAGDMLANFTVGELVNGKAEALSPADSIGDVVDQALRSGQILFPVVNGTQLIGVVHRDEAFAAAAKIGLRANVAHVVRRALPVFPAQTPVLTVRDNMAEFGLPVVVIDGDRFLGVVGSEDLARINDLASRLSAAGIRRPESVHQEPADASRPL
jgi:Zn-dependent protease/CBS domain-containing protein